LDDLDEACIKNDVFKIRNILETHVEGFNNNEK